MFSTRHNCFLIILYTFVKLHHLRKESGVRSQESENKYLSSFLGSAGECFFAEAQEPPVLNTEPEAKPRNGIPRLLPGNENSWLLTPSSSRLLLRAASQMEAIAELPECLFQGWIVRSQLSNFVAAIDHSCVVFAAKFFANSR